MFDDRGAHGQLEARIVRDVEHGVPNAILHAAAITDHTTTDAAALINVNVRGTERVARWCRAYGVKLVYLSTHYVYPGERGRYRESDATRPIGAYAMSKLAGEGWAEQVRDVLIVRGSWYTSETRLRHWIANGVFADAYTSRESADDAAAKIAALTLGGATGVFNIGGPRRSFARILLDEGYPDVPIRERASYVGPYAFPLDVSVSTAKYDAWARGRGAPPAQLALALEGAERVGAH